jgi:hypothetical protein
MGIVRHSLLESYDQLRNDDGDRVSVMTSSVWVNALAASVVAIAMVSAGNHEIASIKQAVHIADDFDGAAAVSKVFEIDA